MKIQSTFFFFFFVTFIYCQKSSLKKYESEDLKVIPLSNHSFRHISYLQTEDYGKVACNGLVIEADGEAIVFDTPINDTVSKELIQWIESQLKCTVTAVVATHFHNDCLGGLKAFHDLGIDSFAYDTTLQLARQNGFAVPHQGFSKSIGLKLGKQRVILDFLGEGHTADNIVGYFPEDKVLFGGCLIKSEGASKGYLGDANLDEWSNTVVKVKLKYPEAEIIVPGHGNPGGMDLLDYTMDLFKE